MPSTTRRSLLFGFCTLLVESSAGCLGQSLPVGSSEKPVPPEEYRRRVSVTNVDSVPKAYGAEFEVNVAQSTVTAERSAVLEVRVTNTNDEERRFSSPYYKGASSTAGTAGLLLYSDGAPDNPANGNDSLAEYAPPCIGTDGKSWNELIWTNEAQIGPTLAPNESWGDELLVADDPTDAGCFPTGEYRFERRFDPSWIDEGFDWGFSLEVENA